MMQVNHSYLIRRCRYGSSIQKIKLISISEKCYEIQFNSNHSPWILKEEFDLEYEIIEDLGKL